MADRTLAEMIADAQRVEAGRAVVPLGSNWGQGRTTFGGLVAALALAAMRHEAPEDRPLRSILVTFAGPIFVGETITIAVEVLRAGGSATMLEARITGEDGTVRTIVQGVFGATRTAKAAPAFKLEDMPDPDAFPSMPNPAPGLPKFLGELDVKWTGSGVPLSGTEDRSLRNFVRLKDETGIGPAARIALIADMPPPIMMSHYKEQVNAASITWSLDFVRPARSLLSGWLFLDYSLTSAEDGYSQQAGKLYGADGTLVAVSQQTMAYFDPKPASPV